MTTVFDSGPVRIGRPASCRESAGESTVTFHTTRGSGSAGRGAAQPALEPVPSGLQLTLPLSDPIAAGRAAADARGGGSRLAPRTGARPGRIRLPIDLAPRDCVSGGD